ncbi:MAG: efflux RND transporter permease subunit [Oligoflexales bacterium]|nr:efflux RND transporter permease subunit [Oligoflexales bacterium]
MSIYAQPKRVYLVLGLAACLGLWSAFKLPVSLFPKSQKATLYIHVPYGSLNAESFVARYGRSLESQLISLDERHPPEHVWTTYDRSQANYMVELSWGANVEDMRVKAQNAIQNLGLPEEISKLSHVNWGDGGGSGFFAATFFSEKRSVIELYDLLKPSLEPKLKQISDAKNAVLWSPIAEELKLNLRDEALISLDLATADVEGALRKALMGSRAGALGTSLNSEFTPRISELEDLKTFSFSPSGDTRVFLPSIADIQFDQSKQSQSFHTNGIPSLILFASPKPGGNLKRMAEDLRQLIQATQLPDDVSWRILVDPSEFIEKAISNVSKELLLSAFLATLVLFLFIGSLRQVITAAIEIPLSLLLAFILMRLSSMNMNLISLSGLALASGMNVDASVVVLEHIMRKRQRHASANPSFSERLALITEAVREVRFPVIASTMTSLVVFIPLFWTSGYAQALLGDLAKAIVFSHGFSALVALILVPTIRLQLSKHQLAGPDQPPLQRPLVYLENLYKRFLLWFIVKPLPKLAFLLFVVSTWLFTFFWVLPRLPRELIGIPETSWLACNLYEEKKSLSFQDMDRQVTKLEQELLAKFPGILDYSFGQIYGSGGTILLKLKNQGDVSDLSQKIETLLTKQLPHLKMRLEPWNPSEFQLPNPPDFVLKLEGGELSQRLALTKEFKEKLLPIYPSLEVGPKLDEQQSLNIKAYSDSYVAKISGVMDKIRLAETPSQIGEIHYGKKMIPLSLSFKSTLKEDKKEAQAEDNEKADQETKDKESLQELGAFPVRVGNKIVPLRAVADLSLSIPPPTVNRKDGIDETKLFAHLSSSDKKLKLEKQTQAENLIEAWKIDHKSELSHEMPSLTVVKEDPELAKSISELKKAASISLFLLFCTLFFQFQSLWEALIVLIAVPLGLLGSLLALYFFQSTLSLNAILGMILLNGIAVANSILLVDLTKNLHKKGRRAIDAVVEGAVTRLRPILITSLTTVLGMIPLALGLGEGGRVLQPLGISVACGLFFSTCLTLCIVPAVHAILLERSK